MWYQHTAHPTFYEGLRRIERICGTDLSSVESRTSLHVALLALERALIRDHENDGFVKPS
jgi:hypothetical protein